MMTFFGVVFVNSASVEALGLRYLASGSRLSAVAIADSLGESCPSGTSSEIVDVSATQGVGYYTGDNTGAQYMCFANLSSTGGGSDSGSGASLTATLVANPSTVDQGVSSSLTWTSVGASTCYGTGFLAGGAISGLLSVTPNSSTTYTITCYGTGGVAIDSATITVIPIVPTPESGEQGGGGGAACSDGIDNDGDGFTDYPSDSGCSGLAGSSESEVSVQCSDGIDNDGNGQTDYPDDSQCASSQDTTEGFALLSLNADRTLVPRGQTTILDWVVLGVTACTLTGSNGDSWTLSGELGNETTSSIQTATTYTLSCLDDQDSPVSTSLTIKLVPQFQEE